jgi:DnaJ-class molecular chaperone
VIRLRHEVAPTPVPPSGVCENCEGRGYVGDGTVKVKCQPCNGTGKR